MSKKKREVLIGSTKARTRKRPRVVSTQPEQVKYLVMSKGGGPYTAAPMFDFWLSGCKRYGWAKTMKNLDSFFSMITYSNMLHGESDIDKFERINFRIIKVTKQGKDWIVGEEL